MFVNLVMIIITTTPLIIYVLFAYILVKNVKLQLSVTPVDLIQLIELELQNVNVKFSFLTVIMN